MASRRMILTSLVHDDSDVLVSRGTALSAGGKTKEEAVYMTVRGTGGSASALMTPDEVDELLKMLVGAQQDAIRVNGGEKPFMS